MGRISRENIEEFLLDYIEGTLDKETHAEVKAFLLHNPDIEEGIYDLDLTYLESAEISYPNKSKLKVTENISEFEDKCILAIENELNPADMQSLESEIAENRTKRDILNLYKNTILSPDESVVFNNKSLLKHLVDYKQRKIIYYSSAAAIILFICISSLLMRNQNTNEVSIIDKYIPIASTIKQEKLINTSPQEPNSHIRLKKTLSKNVGKTIVKSSAKEATPKMSVVNTIPNSEKLLANSILGSPEPDEIIIPEDKYSLADQREFCLNQNAMKWNSNSRIKRKRNNQHIKTLLEVGESKLRTFVSRFVNTTRISHESVTYIAKSEMD